MSQVAPQEDPTRAAAALRLKLMGASFEDIAQALDFANATSAQRAVEQALARSADEYGDKERLRNLLNARMERVMEVCFARALAKNNPDQVAYMRTLAVYIDRMSKMNGLEQAATVVITPGFEEIYTWAKKFHETVSAEPLVLEAEIVEEDILDEQ